MSNFPWLTVSGAIPLIGTLVICLTPGRSAPGSDADRRSRDLVDAFVDEKVLLQPLKWGPVYLPCDKCGSISNRDCLHTSHETRPRRIFVENQSDLFGEWVTDEMLDHIFAVMALCPEHTFQVLTKRPERMQNYLSKAQHRLGEIVFINALRGIGSIDPESIRHPESRRWPYPNFWLGVSVENQAAADERIPLLLQTPAAVRFISAEPLLGPVNIGTWWGWWCHHEDSYSEEETNATICRQCDELVFLDWVIVGGESGHGARPMDPAWARSLRDQCANASVPFFFKQWGAWLGVGQDGGEGRDGAQELNCSDVPVRVGKKAAGALLDGVENKAFPRAL